MMEGIEQILMEEKPDIVLVQGDTNAVLSGSIVAAKLHIAVGHVEAGLRTYDVTSPYPEEFNRQAVGSPLLQPPGWQWRQGGPWDTASSP